MKKGKSPKNFKFFQSLAWKANLGRKASNETKLKMSKSHLGLLVGTKLSQEHREKLRIARLAFYADGGIHPRGMLGKHQTQEHKNKISIANSGEKNSRWKGGYSNTLWYNRQRLYAKKGIIGTHSKEEWLKIKKFYNYICLCCKRNEPEITLTEDHVIPISKGGSNNIENIQPLCQSCNSYKWTQIIDYRHQPVANQPTLALQ